MMKTKILVAGALAFVVATVLTACGPSPDPSRMSQINNYFEGLGTITATPPTVTQPVATGQATTATEPGKDISDNPVTYQCTSTPMSLTTTPETIVIQGDGAAAFWLGALVQGRGYAGGLGSISDVTVGDDRAPLTISTSLPGVTSETIKHPTTSAVDDAIKKMEESSARQSIAPPAAITSDAQSADSTYQAALDAGLSAKYLGISASASTSLNTEAGSSSVYFSLFQSLFSFTIDRPSSPAGYFSGSTTLGTVKGWEQAGQLSPQNPPVVVTKITFGRELLYTATANTDQSSLKAAVDAAYSNGALSGKANVTASEQTILDHAHYAVTAVGGSESATLNLIKTHSLGDYLSAPMKVTDALPVSYELDNMVTGTPASFSETTTYDQTTCGAVAPTQKKVGEVDQITGFYGDSACTSPWLFGQLQLNGTSIYDLPDQGSSKDDGPVGQSGVFNFKTLALSNYADPTPLSGYSGYSPPSNGLPAGTFVLMDVGHYNVQGSNQLRISGQVSDHVTFGAYPENTYDATFTYGSAGLIGPHVITGNSAHCRVDLGFKITKIADLYE